MIIMTNGYIVLDVGTVVDWSGTYTKEIKGISARLNSTSKPVLLVMNGEGNFVTKATNEGVILLQLHLNFEGSITTMQLSIEDDVITFSMITNE